MDDSDDYFTDDLVLDEQTLAALDQEEQKYISQNAAPKLALPTTKRQKTDNGWRPGIGNRRTMNLDETEDLPEISIQSDGSYGVRLGTNIAAISNIHLRARTGVSSTSPLSNSSSGNPPVPPQPPPPKHQPLLLQNGVQQRQRQSHYAQLSMPSLLSPKPPTPDGTSSSSLQLEAQLEDLRQRMEELQKENLKMQMALREATDVKLSREGEVSSLRRSIERTAKDHSAQVTKLQTAKEEADAKQIQMKKEMKEEMERLKTQFIFKQHEFETSMRRPPLSVRSKKIAKDPPPTPIPVPSQIQRWNQDGRDVVGPSRLGDETPVRPQLNLDDSESPKARRVHRTPGKAKKSAMLPGFQNSFITSPVRPSQARSGQGRGRGNEESAESGKGKETEKDPFPSYKASKHPFPISPSCSPTKVYQRLEVDMAINGAGVDARDEEPVVERGLARAGTLEVGDIEMTNEEENRSSSEELDQIEAYDWKQELCRIILTHALPSCTTSTFQTIMRAPLIMSPTVPPESVEAYSTACSQILEVIASSSKYIDYEVALNTISCSLVSIISLLNKTSTISPLVALLDLLMILIYSLPIFSSSLLSHLEKGADRPQILILLCEIVRDQLEHSKLFEQKDALAKGTIDVLEALCWKLPEALVGKLAVILRTNEVMSILLHNCQPSWLLARTARLLAVLATHPKLFRPLLSLPDPDDRIEKQADLHKIHYVERLCSYLIDSTRQDAEAQSMRTSVLAFFATLSISHMDALPILTESHVFIPSLVVVLTHMTTPFWEDDEMLMTSPEAIASSTRTLSQTLLLLHHSVFSMEPVFNLRHKLHHAPHRPFNGITHMFIVTFGRLSYADPPEWVGGQAKAEFELMSEMARDLLELVVEGPEGDSIWAAYQGDSDQESDTDEEEMEAKFLGVNEV